jgi:23S rRNA pseudouridine1911/1915/1917 synthase
MEPLNTSTDDAATAAAAAVAIAAAATASPTHVSPEELATWLIAEDDDFLVINKPGNIVCHPSKSGPWSSVVGAVKEWRKMEAVHLVSRLDRETSGVLLIAKNRDAARASQMAIQDRHATKTYLAILHGQLREPVLVDEPLAHDTQSPVAIKYCVSRTPDAKTAVTFFEPLQTAGDYTLARITPHTGRTHQIRVHAQWLGHPVAGDKLYGPDELLYLEFTETGWGPRHDALLELPRHALHAARLDFKAPDFQRTFVAPLPDDLLTFCGTHLALPPPALQTLLTTAG